MDRRCQATFLLLALLVLGVRPAECWQSGGTPAAQEPSEPPAEPAPPPPDEPPPPEVVYPSPSPVPQPGWGPRRFPGGGAPAPETVRPTPVPPPPRPVPPQERSAEPAPPPPPRAMRTPPEPPRPAQPAAPAGPESKSRKNYALPSVLERFEEFKGERTPRELLDLFRQEMLIGFRQDPPVAVADGKTAVAVTFIAPAELAGVPDVALIGGRMASITRDPDATNFWRAMIVPEKDALSVVMTLPMKDFLMLVPLTVTPSADIRQGRQAAPTEEDFRLFLEGRKAGKDPRFDLNRDGRFDYRDDYIYTANYLAARGGMR